MWELIDYTNGHSTGYLQINHQGKRVADVSPYKRDVDAEWTIEMARHIVATMNVKDGYSVSSQVVVDITSSIRFRDVLGRYYKVERDRAECCLGDIVDILDTSASADRQVEKILQRLIDHYSHSR